MEMETVIRNDYYVSLEDQIKIFNCHKSDFENVTISPFAKNVINTHDDNKTSLIPMMILKRH